MALYRKATGTVRADGRIIPNTNVWIYETGTTDEIPVFNNEAGHGSPLDQPIASNSAGRFSFFLDTIHYPTFRLFFEKSGIDFDQINEDLDGITLPGSSGPPGQGFTWRGSWESNAQYEERDIVEHESIAYICIQDNENEEPPNALYWETFAAAGAPGPTGPTGLPGLLWQGQWTSQGYDENDTVEHEGSAYVCIQDHVSPEEPPNASYWDLVASKGDTGEQGLQGIPGLGWEGEWQDSTQYVYGNVVFHDGNSYVCIQDHTSDGGNVPPDASYWEYLAVQGEKGDYGTPVWTGLWDVARLYTEGEAVFHSDTGSSYVANSETDEIPPHSDWDLLAEKGDQGEQGEEGEIGPAGVVWKGEWDSSDEYDEFDIVHHDGSVWISLEDENTDQEPGSFPAAWALFASQGSQGETGPMGIPGMVWQGEWVSQGYDERQVVQHEGSTYICVEDHPSSQEPPNALYWDLVAEKGEQGETGAPWDAWEGAWVVSTSYTELDAVENNGSSYVCISSHTSGSDNDEPGVGINWETYWDLIAAKGEGIDAEKLRGRDIHTTAPNDGDAYLWNATDNRWEVGEVATDDLPDYAVLRNIMNIRYMRKE